MSTKTQPKTSQPLLNTRILHTMIRVGDLDRSIQFYADAVGMRELRRETFPQGRFTLVFIGYGDEASNTVIELTHNWDEGSYEHGTGYGHIALAVDDIGLVCERLEAMGVKVLRTPGPMSFQANETSEREIIAFIEDPDGYQIELIQKA